MISKAILFLCLTALVLLIASEVTARDLLAETNPTVETNGVEESKYGGGGGGRHGGGGGYYGGGGHYGGGGGGGGGGHYGGGGGCRYRCCHYGRCGCCNSAAEAAKFKSTESKPQH